MMNFRFFIFACLLFVVTCPVRAEKLPFNQWKQKISSDFHQRGISKELLRATMAKIELDAEIIALDRNQPEFSTSLGGYLAKRLTNTRIKRAKEEFKKHAKLLHLIEKKYGVPAEILVAFWSLETNHGSHMGDKNIIRSLVTLAYDGRREKLFTEQLYYALKILHHHPHIQLQSFLGSWAGAMGQPQFMPTTFINYAVDGNNDGKIDLWSDLEDVFHSMGNYLAKLYWTRNQSWGQEVLLPQTMDWEKTGLGWSLPIAEWIKKGIEPINGIAPSNRFQQKASIILPLGHQGPAFMVYDNFRIIMRWNNSVNYALSVGILSDLIAERYYVASLPLQDWRQSYPNRKKIKELQQALELAGYGVGGVDGLIGKKTRRAIIRYQLDHKLVPDGYPNQEVLQQLKMR